MQKIRDTADEFDDNENVKHRAAKLNDRYKKIQQAGKDVENELEENSEVTCFLRDCSEAFEWIKEKKLDLASSDSHHDEWQKAKRD